MADVDADGCEVEPHVSKIPIPQRHDEDETHDAERVSVYAVGGSFLGLVGDDAHDDGDYTRGDAYRCREEVGLETAPAKGDEDGGREDGDGVSGDADGEVEDAADENLPVFEGMESALDGHGFMLAVGLLRIQLKPL